MLGCTCQAVGGFPTFAPCLEHICAGGGGSVANMGLVLLCRRGLYIYALELCYVGMSWADVLSVMLVRGVMCDVRHPRQEEAL